MELLVRIALIVVIITAVTICVLGLLICIPLIVSFYGSYTITETSNELDPPKFLDIINVINEPALRDSYDKDNFGINHNSPEQKYCSMMHSYHAYITPINGTEISVCLFKDNPWELWYDLSNYVPQDYSYAREIQCDNAEGTPIRAPDPFGGHLILCIVDGPVALPHIYDNTY